MSATEGLTNEDLAAAFIAGLAENPGALEGAFAFANLLRACITQLVDSDLPPEEVLIVTTELIAHVGHQLHHLIPPDQLNAIMLRQGHAVAQLLPEDQRP